MATALKTSTEDLGDSRVRVEVEVQHETADENVDGVTLYAQPAAIAVDPPETNRVAAATEAHATEAATTWRPTGCWRRCAQTRRSAGNGRCIVPPRSRMWLLGHGVGGVRGARDSVLYLA